MILVDTSVWIDHFRSTESALVDQLLNGQVVAHPFVIGELAVGLLKRRVEVLEWLAALPAAPVAAHREALGLVEAHGLAGTGLGWIDVHLLASAMLGAHVLWTRDGRLMRAASRLGLAPPGGLGDRGGRTAP